MSIQSKIDRLAIAKNGIADAIENKGVVVGENDGFEDFPELIGQISGGGDPDLVDIAITENGTYNHEGHDGYDKVTVNVPTAPPVISPLSVTENGTYTAPAGTDGYSPVTVNVPAPSPVITSLSVIENGTYTAPEGTDGYSPVIVNVPSTDRLIVVPKENFAKDGTLWIDNNYQYAVSTDGCYCVNADISSYGLSAGDNITIMISGFSNDYVRSGKTIKWMITDEVAVGHGQESHITCSHAAYCHNGFWYSVDFDNIQYANYVSYYVTGERITAGSMNDLIIIKR